ncbi:hypothetical protein ACFOYU_12240 [Microvirga sp. GCM10011540]|uniref:hypothetical protein n=1 Tax=Microvirga sp. GCM10011540 TaxID=3317338 RepID=UPI003623DF6B
MDNDWEGLSTAGHGGGPTREGGAERSGDHDEVQVVQDRLRIELGELLGLARSGAVWVVTEIPGLLLIGG